MAAMAQQGYVRLALPGESGDIARLQREVWGEPGHPGHAMADALDVEAATVVWYRSITRPPLASYRVMVAVVPAPHGSRGRVEQVVGFVAVSPSDDPDALPTDGSVAELAVAAAVREDGHRTRLIQAAVDTLGADGFTRARWWVPTTDDDLRRELDESGWAPDGAHLELRHPDDESLRLKLVRLHTAIA